MKKIILISFSLFLFHCTNSPKSENPEDSLSVVDTLVTEIDTTRVTSAYEEKLKTLSLTEESSLKALELFKSTYKSENLEENDKALLAYLNFQQRLLDSLDYQLESREDYDKLMTLMSDSVAPEAKEIEKDIQAKGLALGQSEGMLYYMPYPQVIGNYFLPYLSASTKEYYQQFLQETNQPYAEDGGLIISTEEVAGRLIFWDKFVTTYPNHLFAGDAKSRYNAYLYSLLIGMDNTPAFDRETHKLQKDFSEVYIDISKKNPGTKTAKIFNDYLNVLAESKNTESDRVTKFIQEVKGY